MDTQLNDLIRILQTSISPVTLISGVGLLVLSMTNRFARTTDRARVLAHDVPHAAPAEADNLRHQIQVLYRRSQLLLLSISSALTSVFFVGLLIISLFVGSTASFNLQLLVSWLFGLSLIALVVSLALFIADMTVSLRALKLEIEEHVEKPFHPLVLGQ